MRTKIEDVFPFVDWLPTLRHSFRADILCGLTIALVLIPQAMAYAQIAGLPPAYGLYAALVPGIIGALFGYSQYLATGPTAMSAMLTFALLHAEFGSDIPPQQYVQLAILMAFICGAVLFLAGVLRLGLVANFLSDPVLRGFTTAAALIIASSQFDNLIGVSTAGDVHFFEKLRQLFHAVPVACPYTVGVSVLALLLMWAVRRYLRGVPEALAAAGLLTLGVYLFARFGAELPVRVVGDIPRGMPGFAAPELLFDWPTVLRILPQALPVAFIIFMEMSSVCKALAEKTRDRVYLNSELAGQGLACMGGSFFGSYPVGGSLSRSALCYANGGKTGLSHIVASLAVLATLLWLTPLLYYMPKAALSALIIMAVLKLVDFRGMLRAWKARRSDGICAVFTFLVTLYLAPAITDGILYGAGLAILLYLRDTMKPRACLVEPHADGRLRDAKRHRIGIDAEFPAVRFDGRLYFANVAYFERTVLEVTREFPQARHILILGEGINDIDSSGEHMLRQLTGNLREGGRQLVFVGLKEQVLEVLERTGFCENAGAGSFFSTCEAARKALRQTGAQSAKDRA